MAGRAKWAKMAFILRVGKMMGPGECTGEKSLNPCFWIKNKGPESLNPLKPRFWAFLPLRGTLRAFSCKFIGSLNGYQNQDREAKTPCAEGRSCAFRRNRAAQKSDDMA